MRLSIILYARASVRHGWLDNTWPDCLFYIYQLVQVTENQFNKDNKNHIKRSNISTGYSLDSPLPILITQLYDTTMQIIGYSDRLFE